MNYEPSPQNKMIDANRYDLSSVDRVSLKTVLFSAIIAVAVFVFDTNLPLGVAGGVPYVALVLMGSWYPRPRHIFLLAVLSSVLVAVGFFLSPGNGIPWMVLSNRGLALFAIWFTAFLIVSRKSIRSELSQKDALLKDALESIPDGFALFDADDGFIAFNDAFYMDQPPPIFRPQTGMSYEAFIRARNQMGIEIILESGEKLSIEERLERHQNPSGPIETPTRDGRILQTVEFKTRNGGTGLICTDITRIKKAEQVSQERLNDVSLTSSDRLWETDENFRFTWIEDRRGTELFPPPDWGIGKTRWEFREIDLERDEHWRKHYEDHMAHRKYRDFEFSSVDEKGDVHYWLASGNPYFDDDGNFAGYRGSSTDITSRKRSEEKALWLMNVIEGVSETVAIYDREDKLLFANKAFRERNKLIPDYIKPGVAYEEFIRESVAKGLIPDADGCEQEWIAERLRKHKTGGAPFELVRHDSHLLIHEQKLSDGGVASISVDIGAQKEAEKAAAISAARLQEIISIAPEAVITIGGDMEIQMFNNGAERIFGYTAEEVLGQPMDILMPVSSRKDHGRQIESFSQSPEVYRLMDQRDDIAGLRKDGTEFPAIASVSKSEIAGEVIFTVMLHDVTDRRQVERERMNALADAEKANQAKSQFLASMSHELRTPLNAIIGFADILSNEYLGAHQQPKYKEYAGDIHSSGEHLLSLVNDILDISTIEAGKKSLKIEALDFKEIAVECMNVVAHNATNKDLNLITNVAEQMPLLNADRRATRQIILNLLTNAIKFTPGPGDITLSAQALDNNIVIKIIDTGPGIPEENLHELTKPFARLEQDSFRAVEGWGLGLAITKSLIDLHGGKLDFDSVLGQGTTVTVTLPNSGVG